nr:hypothetical protein [uncultured Rhodoferax sp.]
MFARHATTFQLDSSPRDPIDSFMFPFKVSSDYLVEPAATSWNKEVASNKDGIMFACGITSVAQSLQADRGKVWFVYRTV